MVIFSNAPLWQFETGSGIPSEVPELLPCSTKFLTQAGGTTGAGQHAGRWHPVPAARAIEPVMTVVTLRIGQPLLALAFRALPDHFLVIEVVSKQQAAARTAR